MKSGGYFLGLILTVLIAGASWAALLIYFNPFSASIFIFILFYLSLFILSASLFTLVGWLIRWVSQRKSLELSRHRFLKQWEISFRQGILLGFVLVSVLILQGQRMLSWWHLLAIIGLVTLIEWWLSKR